LKSCLAVNIHGPWSLGTIINSKCLTLYVELDGLKLLNHIYCRHLDAVPFALCLLMTSPWLLIFHINSLTVLWSWILV